MMDHVTTECPLYSDNYPWTLLSVFYLGSFSPVISLYTQDRNVICDMYVYIATAVWPYVSVIRGCIIISYVQPLNV